jgi:hypothetical protein
MAHAGIDVLSRPVRGKALVLVFRNTLDSKYFNSSAVPIYTMPFQTVKITTGYVILQQ